MNHTIIALLVAVYATTIYSLTANLIDPEFALYYMLSGIFNYLTSKRLYSKLKSIV